MIPPHPTPKSDIIARKVKNCLSNTYNLVRTAAYNGECRTIVRVDDIFGLFMPKPGWKEYCSSLHDEGYIIGLALGGCVDISWPCKRRSMQHGDKTHS